MELTKQEINDTVKMIQLGMDLLSSGRKSDKDKLKDYQDKQTILKVIDKLLK
jgi:hypothetical protein